MPRRYWLETLGCPKNQVDSDKLAGTLEADGYLPAWLARRGAKSGAPWASILVGSVAFTACLGIGFARLVELDVLLYGVSLALEFAALVVLRVREPRLERPFRVPGGTVGAALWSLAPLSLLGVAAWHGAGEPPDSGSSVNPLVLGGILVALGPVVYALRRRPV